MSSRLMIAAFGAAMMSLSSFGGSTYTWSGATSGNVLWNTAANWKIGTETASVAPTSGDIVKFTSENCEITFTDDVVLENDSQLEIQFPSKNTCKVHFAGVISGEGGITRKNAGILYLDNEANTFHGPVQFYGGWSAETIVKTIAKIGETSSLGQPLTAEKALMTFDGNSSRVSIVNTGTFETDRPGAGFVYLTPQYSTINYRGSLAKASGVGARGHTGTLNVYSALTGSVSRTDGGVINMLSTENKITGVGSAQGNINITRFGSNSKQIALTCGQTGSSSQGNIHYTGTESIDLNAYLQSNRLGYFGATHSDVTVRLTGGIKGYKWQSSPEKYSVMHLYQSGTLVFAGNVDEKVSLNVDSACTAIFNGSITARGDNSVNDTAKIYVNGTWSNNDATITSSNTALLAGTGTVTVAQIGGTGCWGAGTPDTIGTLTLKPANALTFGKGGQGYFRMMRETNDMIVVDQSVVINKTTVNFSCPEEYYVAKTYQLIKWNGYTTGDGTFVLGTGAPAGSELRVENDGLYLDMPRSGYKPWVWAGEAGTQNWDANSTFTLNGGTAQAWCGDGEAAIFDDTVGGDLDLTLKAAVTPAQVRFNNSTHEMSFQIGAGGSLDATAEIIKLGADTLTLKGDIAVKKVIVGEGTLILDGNLAGADVVVSNGAHFVQSNTESVISGEDLTLTFGNGTNTLKGANTFTGNVIQKPSGNAAAFLELYSDNALGAATNILVYGHINSVTGIDLKDGCIIRGVTLMIGDSSGGRPGIYAADPNATTCGWYGDIVSYPGKTADNLYFTADYNNSIACTLVVGDPEGPGTNVISGTYNSISLRGWAGTRKIYSRFSGPNSIGQNDMGTTYFYATNNVYSSFTVYEGYARAGVANTFCKTSVIWFGKGNSASAYLCLDGFDQEARGIQNNNTNQKGYHYIETANDKPCTLTLKPASGQTYSFGDPSYACSSFISGPVSIVKKGAGTQKFGAVFATTGEVRVEEGVLNLTTNAFPQASCLAVAGGKVKVDADATIKHLFLGGEVQKKGTYGSSESSAENKNDTYFSGKGVITVTKGKGIFVLFH